MCFFKRNLDCATNMIVGIECSNELDVFGGGLIGLGECPDSARIF
jgi:hypothetical protein